MRPRRLIIDNKRIVPKKKEPLKPYPLPKQQEETPKVIPGYITVSFPVGPGNWLIWNPQEDGQNNNDFVYDDSYYFYESSGHIDSGSLWSSSADYYVAGYFSSTAGYPL